VLFVVVTRLPVLCVLLLLLLLLQS